MDPNANLDELRELVSNLLEHADRDNGQFLFNRRDDVLRVCELLAALDEWIVKGGALPQRWTWRGPAAARATQIADLVRHGGTIVATTTPAERKEARQALVYENALKFVREVAGMHYLVPRDFTQAQYDLGVALIDKARTINRAAEEAWR